MAGRGIITINGHEWLVDLAITSWELGQGLGGLPELAPGTGMLFDLRSEQQITMTTVPMLFPLDIAFLSEDLTVTEVCRNIEPGYLVTSTLPARYFLEVNAGELEGIEAGDSLDLTVLSWGSTATSSDSISAVFGFMTFMMMGVFLVGMVRSLVDEAFIEPKKKPFIYGPRGELLMAETKPKTQLWNEIALTIQRSLSHRTDRPLDECQRIAESVAGRIEKRAGQLAWLELRNGTTFERVGKAPIKQGLKIFAAVDGYLGIGSDLWHADRVAIAELVDDALMTVDEIHLQDGTVFRKTFVPGQSLPSVRAKTDEPSGTCYADAWRFLIKEGEGTLVHGSVFSDGRRIDHAWVETLTGWIWEPQTGTYMTKLAFRYEASPIEEDRYSPEEAAIMVARTGHFGPWSEDERQQYLLDKKKAVVKRTSLQAGQSDGLDILPDSPEYLAYTIDDIGFRDIIDSAFLEAIKRARVVR